MGPGPKHSSCLKKKKTSQGCYCFISCQIEQTPHKWRLLHFLPSQTKTGRKEITFPGLFMLSYRIQPFEQGGFCFRVRLSERSLSSIQYPNWDRRDCVMNRTTPTFPQQFTHSLQETPQYPTDIKSRYSCAQPYNSNQTSHRLNR